ncbi:NAD(P)-dependent alcohol dehydrogenase [Streptomyces sp. DSM 40750]|uniref:NAD(P)-dependent alcohol dehydrogenase n=1 Tax=Streptomyces sp. DSM 40750 TaxID=2801030 RepID=UPI00214B5FD2|nr:NAD(P)-dependent alcohol dehydrogenase [Streptomyces sp. DSM 40750]UUU19186.1 NAD(P)-dependent alcohol dehydrogenase [Streptomyces sp. DSM 40750]UUU27470.1 NAD(P)-dependent alcohol dehydrogenase [Streptomyces sp. DSM 40750]
MPTTTTAAVLEAPGQPFAFHQVELDDLRADEVLVRMVAAGLCHTDLSVQAGHIPFPLPGVIGHEGAGVVEAVGSAVTRVAPGDSVALSFTSCGRCGQCRGGHPAYCATWLPANIFNNGTRADGSATLRRGGTVLGGRFFGQSSLSAKAVVDERSVVKVGSDLPLHLVAPLGCGIQTGAGTVLNVLRPEPGSTLAVFGTGAVGLAAIAAAALTPLSAVIAVDLVDHRLDVALGLGATHRVNAGTEDIAKALAGITDGAGLDYAIDTTANMSVLRTAVDALGTLGRAAAIGATTPGTELALDYQGLLVGRSIVGVTEGDADPESLIPLLAGLYRQDRLPLDAIVRTYPFSEINQAVADARDGTAIKPVLLFDAV